MEMDMPIPKGRGFTPFPFGQCQVCGAEATGNHYGANTCEGCKGFFKRSLPVFRTFRCFFGNKCEVTPETRNRCKACRFRKCVEAGMALDAVKMGRIPKAVKEHAMEGKSSHRINRQISGTSLATSQNSGTTASSSPGAASSPLGNASSPGSSSGGGDFNHQRDDASPLPASNAAGGQTAFRGLADVRRYSTNPPSGFNGVSGGNSSGGGMNKSMGPSDYRFHPYARQEQHFKAAERSGYPPYNGGSSGLLYHGVDDAKKSGPMDRSWPPTSQMPILDYTTTNRRGSSSDQPAGMKPMGGAFVGGQKPVMNFSAGLSGGAVSFADMKTGRAQYHPEVKPPSARVRAMADMAITGDFNENEPDLVDSNNEKLRAAMANRETAVAVADPSLRGAHHSMPVVPGDVFVFQPSYVPHDKWTETHGFGSDNTAKSKLNWKKRRLTSEESQGMNYKIPSFPNAEFFAQMSVNPVLKSLMCENTFRVVGAQNSAIYGEETRANEEFLKKAMGSGSPLPVEELTGQQMRDVLKDRLITQVKRVVQLSEAIPGFRSLNVKDQHALLRTCILDVWMVHSARFLRDEHSFIMFLETKTHYSRYWMEQFLTDEFLNTVFQIATKINSLDLSFDELALLKSILIVRPDRQGLENVEFITVLHNHLLDSLKVAITTRRPVESSQLLDDFLELLKGWSILDLMQEKYVHPIDLSQISQGPWKIGEVPGGSVAGSVSSKTSDRDTAKSVSPKPKQQLVETNPAQQSVSLQT